MAAATRARLRLAAKKARRDARRDIRAQNNRNPLDRVNVADTGKVIASVKAKLPPRKWRVPEVDLRKYATTNPFDWRPVTRLRRFRHPKRYPIPALDRLVQRHFKATNEPPLKIDGDYKPLMYMLISTLISAPYNKAVVVIDLAHQFRASEVLKHAPWSYSKEPPAPRPVRLRSRFRPRKPRAQKRAKKRKAAQQLGRPAKRVRGLLPGQTLVGQATGALPRPDVESHREQDAAGRERKPSSKPPVRPRARSRSRKGSFVCEEGCCVTPWYRRCQLVQPPWPFSVVNTHEDEESVEDDAEKQRAQRPAETSGPATQPSSDQPKSEPQPADLLTNNSTGQSQTQPSIRRSRMRGFKGSKGTSTEERPPSSTGSRLDQRSGVDPERPRPSDGYYLQLRPQKARKPTDRAGSKRKRSSRTAVEASAAPLPKRLAPSNGITQPRSTGQPRPRVVRRSGARRRAELSARWVDWTRRAIYAAQTEYMKAHNGVCPKWLPKNYRHYYDVKDKIYPENIARRWMRMATGRDGPRHLTEEILKQVPYHVPGRPRPGTSGFEAVGQPKQRRQQKPQFETSNHDGKRGVSATRPLSSAMKAMIAEKRRLAEKRWAANPNREIITAQLKGTVLSRAERNKLEARRRFEARGGAQLVAQLKAGLPAAPSYATQSQKLDFVPQPSLTVFTANTDGFNEYAQDEEFTDLVEDDYGDRIEPEIEESADHYNEYDQDDSGYFYTGTQAEEDDSGYVYTGTQAEEDDASFVFTGTQARLATERRLAAGRGAEEEVDEDDEDVDGSFVFTGTQARLATERRLAAGREGEEEEVDKGKEPRPRRTPPRWRPLQVYEAPRSMSPVAAPLTSMSMTSMNMLTLPPTTVKSSPAPAPRTTPASRQVTGPPPVPTAALSSKQAMGPPPKPSATLSSNQVMGPPPRPAVAASHVPTPRPKPTPEQQARWDASKAAAIARRRAIETAEAAEKAAEQAAKQVAKKAVEQAAQQAAREAAEQAAQQAAEEAARSPPRATVLHPQIGRFQMYLPPPWQPDMRVENPYRFNPETCPRVKRKRAESIRSSARSTPKLRGGSEDKPAWTLHDLAREAEAKDTTPKAKRQRKTARGGQPEVSRATEPRQSTTPAASEDMNSGVPARKRHEEAKARKDRAAAEIAAKKRAEEEAEMKKIVEEAAARKRAEELAEQKRLEELAAAEQKRLRELAAAEQQRLDELAAAEQERLDAEQRRLEELAAEELKRSEEFAAAEQRKEEELAAAERAKQVAADGKYASECAAQQRADERKRAQAEAAGPSRQSPFMKSQQATAKTPAGKIKQEKRQSAKSNKGKGKQASSQIHGSQDVRSFFTPKQADPARPETPAGSTKKEEEEERVTRAREERVQEVLILFPHLDRRTIHWDLERTDGNVEGTINRALDDRLEPPPAEYQAPPLPIEQSATAAGQGEFQGSRREDSEQSISQPVAAGSEASQQASSSEGESQQSSAASKSQSTSQQALQPKSQQDGVQEDTAQSTGKQQSESQEARSQPGTSQAATTQQAAPQQDVAGWTLDGPELSVATSNPAKKLDARSLAAPGQELEAKMDQLAPEVEARVAARLLAADEEDRATPKDFLDPTIAITEEKDLKQQEGSAKQHSVHATLAVLPTTALPVDVQSKLNFNKRNAQEKMAAQLQDIKARDGEQKRGVRPPIRKNWTAADEVEFQQVMAQLEQLDAEETKRRTSRLEAAKVVSDPTEPGKEAEPALEARADHHLQSLLKPATTSKGSSVEKPKRTVRFAPAGEQEMSAKSAQSKAPREAAARPVASAPIKPAVSPLKQNPAASSKPTTGCKPSAPTAKPSPSKPPAKPFTPRQVDPENLKHVYVVRPRNHPKNLWPEAEGYAQTKQIVNAARTFIREGKHDSHDREIWGTIIIGHKRSVADDADFEADVVCGTVHGWLNVQREILRPFQPGRSVREYLAARDMRNQDRMEADNYYGTSPWAQIAFNNRGLAVGTWDRMWTKKAQRAEMKRARFAARSRR